MCSHDEIFCITQNGHFFVILQRAPGQRRVLAHPALHHMYPSDPAAPDPALVPREPALPTH